MKKLTNDKIYHVWSDDEEYCDYILFAKTSDEAKCKVLISFTQESYENTIDIDKQDLHVEQFEDVQNLTDTRLTQ